MEPLTDNKELVKKINSLGANTRRRIWIAVPFIGGWPTVRTIIGNNLHLGNLQVRLLTDSNFLNIRNKDTVDVFRKYGEVKHINGLHAKIYIFDDQVVVTSANLTDTAFTRRTEIGLFLPSIESVPIITFFEYLWDKRGGVISPDFVFKEIKTKTGYERQEETGEGLPKNFELSDILHDPGPTVATRTKRDNYENFLKCYINFKEIYVENIKYRCWPEIPLYFETDTFLDYLLHKAKNTPSAKYRNTSTPNSIDESQRLELISTYVKQFKEWVKGNKEQPRVEKSRTIQKRLNPINIEKISLDDITLVVNQLECLGGKNKGKHGHKGRFLDYAKTHIEEVISSWNRLLHSNHESLDIRIKACNLPHFGPSSKQELIGWFYPDAYPLRNSNTDAGLRFFGYDV